MYTHHIIIVCVSLFIANVKILPPAINQQSTSRCHYLQAHFIEGKIPQAALTNFTIH